MLDYDASEGDLVLAAIAARVRVGQTRVRIECPLCEMRVGRRDRKASLAVDLVKKRFKCFRCAAWGRIPEDRFDLPVQYVAEPEPTPGPPESFCRIDPRSIMQREAVAYLRGRGLSDALVAEAGIGACTSGKFAGRVVVPVYDVNGQWVWHVGRAWTKHAERPYLYPRGGRGATLYNERALHDDGCVPVMVVEGAFDALALWPNGVAVLGKPTPAHLFKLARTHRPVVVCLDGDAFDDAWGSVVQLRLMGKEDVGVIRMPPKVDPDEVPRAAMDELAEMAIEKGHVDAEAHL